VEKKYIIDDKKRLLSLALEILCLLCDFASKLPDVEGKWDKYEKKCLYNIVKQIDEIMYDMAHLSIFNYYDN